MSAPLFHRGHYNIIAAQFRDMIAETMGTDSPGENAMAILARVTLAEFCMRLAQRFEQDNPEFDALKFLEQCSPDNDSYPITELWLDRDSHD